MYEAEIALLRGDVEARFGQAYLEDVERLSSFFQQQDIDAREYVLSVWTTLKNDAKAKKADPREPMDRLYEMIMEANLFEALSEEQINQRILGWFAR
jgi:deoxyribonuclease-4